MQQKGKQQYQKVSKTGRFHEVYESGARLLVNLTDYLDTGLFLDHRKTRHRIQELAKGKCFLNLYGYTGSASIHAALGGASKTVTVDLSQVYLGWARSNLLRNGFSEFNHHLVQADCLDWLKKSREQFELIFMDPPTFSNSKRSKSVLDIQKDHVELISEAMKHLSPDGLLIFSSNFKKFRLDEDALLGYQVKEVTEKSLSPDFSRGRPIHRCWEITHGSLLEKKADPWAAAREKFSGLVE